MLQSPREAVYMFTPSRGALAAVPRWPARRISSVPWPRELGEQVRGVFLLAALLGNLLVLPTMSSTRGPVLVGLSGLAALALVGIWVTGYRRRKFAWWCDPLELVLMLLLGLGQGSASITLGPIYNVIFLRSLYGGVTAAALRTLGYIGRPGDHLPSPRSDAATRATRGVAVAESGDVHVDRQAAERGAASAGSRWHPRTPARRQWNPTIAGPH